MLRHFLRRSPPARAARAYHQKVVDHYENPRNVGSFDREDPNVGTGLVGAPACGDVMKLQVGSARGAPRAWLLPPLGLSRAPRRARGGAF